MATGFASENPALHACHVQVSSAGGRVETEDPAPEWVRSLVEHHGLRQSQDLLHRTGFEFWLTLSVLKVTR